MAPSDIKAAEDIATLRKQIDVVDDAIIELLLKRIELSNLVMGSKQPAQILDPGREQMILKRYSEKLSKVSTPTKLQRLVSAILATSQLYPEPMSLPNSGL